MKLFIDSSTIYLYLAVIGDDCAYSFYRMGKNDHSETLTNYLDEFLKKYDLKIEDVTEVYVGRGPGSYTGLRIAGTVAKVLAFVKELPFYSFSSLDLLVSKKLLEKGKYIARIKAKKNYSYIKIYTVGDSIHEDLVDTFVNDEEILKYQEYSEIIVTDDFFKNGELLAQNILKYQLFKPEDKYNYVPNYLRSELS